MSTQNKINFIYTYAADDEKDFFSFSLDGGLDNATIGGATVIGVGTLLIIVGCAIIFGDVPVCVVSAGAAGMAAAPHGLRLFLGSAQRAVRPVLRRAVRGGVSVCQNARLCPELVAQRAELRCTARRWQFCADAAALPPAAPCTANGKKAAANLTRL